VQDVGSYGRLAQCAKASAGKRSGIAGKNIGNAYLQGAFSAAVVLLLRNHAPGHKSLARLEQQHGTGTALTMLAPKLARAVYDILKREVACDMATFMHG
jgi:hypothetical protein